MNREDEPKAGSDVLARLRLLILKSQYGAGAKLPSERDIAAQLRVGRPAVREAIKALCMLEVLESRRGAGTFVRSLAGLKQDWPVPINAEDLEFNLIELLEVRRMLEPPAAALAAARATDAHLQEMRRSLEVQEKRHDDRQIASQEDHLFHDAIIRAAGNRVLYDISRVLTPLLIKSRTITAGAATDFRGMLQMHRLIYEAILRGDPETARRGMVDHLHMVGMDLLATPRRDVE
jgi:GntR family transcriptional repressor for pyruvate dehydrogenase complex